MSLSARRAWIEIALYEDVNAKGDVALRKESVDRNIWPVAYDATNHVSLSARRAWIEIIPRRGTLRSTHKVALRKESVDRNCYDKKMAGFAALSLSARRAWIEMIQTLAHLCLKPVALRKESVDRNDFSGLWRGN